MSGIREKVAWSLAAALALMVLAAVTGIVQGGPLDPQGAPAPTMRTLDELPPAWDSVLAANDGPNSCNSSRFTCGDLGVLDHETGLVWSSPGQLAALNWNQARVTCMTANIGGRRGWRLPTMEEFSSLIVQANPAPNLPLGHPFGTVPTDDHYWTATTTDGNANFALAVDLSTDPGTGVIADDKANANHLWCVRGAPVDSGLGIPPPPPN